MKVEKRKQGKKTKFYLAHPIRIGRKVIKIRRYLGSDLSKSQLNKILPLAKALLSEQVMQHKNPLFYELSQEDIAFYKKLESKIRIEHLNIQEWKEFKKEFTYNTNAIEGSTVSEDEVKGILDKQIMPKNNEEIESRNVAEAVEYIKNTKERLSVPLMNRLHEMCFRGTKHFAGKIRAVHVVIKDSSGNIVHEGAPISKINELIEDLFRWYDKNEDRYPALLLASVVHNQFEHIHPYQDGNGRVGRLLLNYVLLKKSYPPVNICLEDRSKYYECLQIFSKKGDIKPTIKFIVQQYRKLGGHKSR